MHNIAPTQRPLTALQSYFNDHEILNEESSMGVERSIPELMLALHPWTRLLTRSGTKRTISPTNILINSKKRKINICWIRFSWSYLINIIEKPIVKI